MLCLFVFVLTHQERAILFQVHGKKRIYLTYLSNTSKLEITSPPTRYFFGGAKELRPMCIGFGR